MSDTPRTDELVTELEGLHSGAQADDLEDLCRTLERELSLAVAKVGEMERDARRYRWLRDGGSPGAYTAWQDEGGSWEGQPIHGDKLDWHVDAALKQSDQQGEK